MHGARSEFADGNHFITAHDRAKLYETHPHRLTDIGSVVLHRLQSVMHHEMPLPPQSQNMTLDKWKYPAKTMGRNPLDIAFAILDTIKRPEPGEADIIIDVDGNPEMPEILGFVGAKLAELTIVPNFEA